MDSGRVDHKVAVMQQLGCQPPEEEEEEDERGACGGRVEYSEIVRSGNPERNFGFSRNINNSKVKV